MPGVFRYGAGLGRRMLPIGMVAPRNPTPRIPLQRIPIEVVEIGQVRRTKIGLNSKPCEATVFCPCVSPRSTASSNRAATLRSRLRRAHGGNFGHADAPSTRALPPPKPAAANVRMGSRLRRTLLRLTVQVAGGKRDQANGDEESGQNDMTTGKYSPTGLCPDRLPPERTKRTAKVLPA